MLCGHMNERTLHKIPKNTTILSLIGWSINYNLQWDYKNYGLATTGKDFIHFEDTYFTVDNIVGKCKVSVINVEPDAHVHYPILK